jgi:Xaa-Pro dipeptidase
MLPLKGHNHQPTKMFILWSSVKCNDKMKMLPDSADFRLKHFTEATSGKGEMNLTGLEEVLLKEKRLHQLMDEEGLDGILLKKQPNFSWFTAGGCNRVGMATETGVTTLLVTRTARFVIANKIEMQRMLLEEELENLGFQPLEFEWYVDREAELVQSIVPNLSRVGADMEFAGTRPMDGNIKKLRYSLTANEVDRYRFLGEKLSIAFENVMLGIRPGDKECEIAGRFGPELWKDQIDLTGILVAADERISSYRHPLPTQKIVNRCVLASVNARYKGLITSLTRMVHFGQPAPKLANQFEQNLEIENRMIAATEIGKPMAAVFETALAGYRRSGFPQEWKLHHQGGSMGYYGRDIKVTSETKDTVQENQAFCWNPTITGTKTEDGFIATSRGPVMISHPVVFPQIEQQINGLLFVRPGMLVVD